MEKDWKGTMLKEIATDYGILFLTDEIELLREMEKRGEKVALVVTDANRDMDFSGISYAVEKTEELEQEDVERLYRRLAGLPWDILETSRCRLREMTVADVDRLYEIYEDASVTKFMEDLYEDREKERKYVEDYCKYIYGFYGYGIWIIEEKSSGEIIGRAGVEPREEGVELGYVIADAWQHRGIAFELCSAVLKYIRKDIGWEKVICRVHPGNKASIGLLYKLGFCRSGKVDGEGMMEFELPGSGEEGQKKIHV